MDLRASSTVLDTVVFVLLVGAAVVVLGGLDTAEPADHDRVADETADVLATSTTEVTFERSGTVTDHRLLGVVASTEASPAERTLTVSRRAHGTYAQLLATVAVANVTLGPRSLTGTGGDMEREVTNATARVLPTGEANVEVRVTWRAYANATLDRELVVGRRPPPDADLSATTVTVASGFPNVSAQTPPDPTYEDVARAVARGVVAGLFPPGPTADALASEGPDRAVVAERYRRASAVLDADTADALAEGNATAANRRLVEALVPRLRADLTAEFDSPEAAARATSLDRVRIVVRTWSP